jgi:hypothetical protein
VTHTITAQGLFDQRIPQLLLLWGVIIVCFAQILYGQGQTVSSVDEKTIVIDDAPEMEVFAFGKSVVIKNRAKSVFAFGGNILIEGQVEGDVGVLGGSLIQKEGAFIGGDIIVIGGTYRAESQNPRRAEDKQTIMFGMFEEEIRGLAENPTQIFSPTFSLAFVAQRVLSVLFWFVVSLGLTTLAPGAVSRAITRFQLSTTKVIGIGFLAFLVTMICIVGSLSFLPSYINAIFGLMAVVLLMLAYVFGRVTLQVSIGKIVQKYFFSEKNRSETLAILIGVLVWTTLLSVPYIWTFGVLALFSAGIGLVLTARSANGWMKN